MSDSRLGRFFGVAARSQTWLNVLFQWLAFPLGLFYFVFLSVGLSLGLGLTIIWVGIPILLIVAGAWWLFGAFERLQARYLLGADVPGAPRSWERVDGVWAKLKAHFGNGATWKDLVYLFAKLPLGIVATTLLGTVGAVVVWCFALPVAAIGHFDIVTTSAGGWQPPLWLGALGAPAGVIAFFAGLHLLNAWGWVCRWWALALFAGPRAAVPPAAGVVRTEENAATPEAPVLPAARQVPGPQ
ncbi:MAG: sensor domain-containing protein [Thermoleophilia bacterium]